MKANIHDDFVEYACELLVPLGQVYAHRMFGGYGIYIDSVFCAIVAGDTLYLKTDARTRGDFEALGYAAFKPFADKDVAMSYYEVPARVMDDRSAIVEWGRKALEAARRAGKRAPARRRSRASKSKVK